MIRGEAISTTQANEHWLVFSDSVADAPITVVGFWSARDSIEIASSINNLTEDRPVEDYRVKFRPVCMTELNKRFMVYLNDGYFINLAPSAL